MAKKLIRQVNEYSFLYRDDRTGVAWVTDGRVGFSHSCHPNIDASGSVRGMKQLGYWDKHDHIEKCNGYNYNCSRISINENDPLDVLAYNECQCVECQKRREKMAYK